MAKIPHIPQTELERQDNRTKRADAFWNAFLPTKNGKVKSTLIINSFCLSLLFVAVYVMAYLLLLDGLDAALAKKLPLPLVNLMESLIPAVIGTVLCNVLHFVFSEKRLVPAAYIWLLFYAITGCIYLLAGAGADTRGTTFQLLMLVVPAPVLTGSGLTLWLYLRHQKLHPPRQPMEELPPWKQHKQF